MQSCVIAFIPTSNFLKKSAMFLEIHLFLLLSFVLASIPLSSSNYVNPSALDTDLGKANITCGSAPYPFGSAGTALAGFELYCPRGLWTYPCYLTISKEIYIVQEISLQGYIKILSGPIQRRCIGANGKFIEQVSRDFNLEGTPFTLSYQYSLLTVVGCNNLVLISRRDKNLKSGCVTFCDPQDTLLSGSCSGLNCCQATLPGTLKSFDLKFNQVSVLKSTGDLIKCSTAFFAPRDDFQSNKSRFLLQNFHDYDQYSQSDHLIKLDWAIGNKSCEVARNDNGFFACKSNSYCYDSPSMAGYLCNCRQGYKGNPYDKDGCTGIIQFFNPGSCRCLKLYPIIPDEMMFVLLFRY
jgi:hypothetical protein